MKFEWGTIKCKDFIEFNPAVPLKKGKVARKIPMEILNPYCKYTQSNLFEEYKGGAKFINNDTIMARITPCLENGKTAFIDCLDEDEAAFGSTEFTVLRAIKDVSDPQFIYYLTIYEPFKNAAVSSMTGSSGRQRVQLDALKEYEINVPDLATQQKIGHILSLFDEKIRINSQINDNLEKQIKLFSNKYFGTDSFEYVGNDDWEIISLSEIANFIGGYSYKSNELTASDIGMATIKNFNRNGGFKCDGYKAIIPSDKIKPEHFAEIFDVLVAHTDLTQKAEIIGNAEPILDFGNFKKIIFSMDNVKVIPKNQNVSKFIIAAILKSDKFKEHCLEYINGTTVLHLSKKALKEYQICFPKNQNAITKLDNIFSSIYIKLAHTYNEIKNLETIRTIILPKLMSGELDVSEIAI